MSARRGCLFAFIGALGVASALAALVGPLLVREGRRFYAPIAKLKRTEGGFDALRERHPWTEPREITLDADQLARFLAARRALSAIDAEASFDPDALENEPDVRAVGEALQGAGDLLERQLDVFARARMTPAEYHYVERLIYRRWRPALLRAGTYPAALRLAASEVEAVAARAPRPDLARALRDVAAQMRARVPAAPSGIPEAVHALLLERVDDIERGSLDAPHEARDRR